MKKLKGSLSSSCFKSNSNCHDKTDIVLRSLDSEIKENKLSISMGWMGIQSRDYLKINELSVSSMKNDLIQFLSGDKYINKFYAYHDAGFTYTDENHSDVAQFFFRDKDWGCDGVFENMTINFASCMVDKPNRNGFMFTETCLYKNISLFRDGLIYHCKNNQPYFLDSTNFTNTSIGSPSFPIDNRLVSDKAIRIGGQKKAPICKNCIIHSYDGLEIVVDKKHKSGVKSIVYDKKMNKTEREEFFLDCL